MGSKSSPRVFQAVFVLALMVLVSSGIGSVYFWGQPASGSNSSLAVQIALPEFKLVERSGRSISKTDLLGHTWIADFVFTSCAGPCPMMSRRMQQLQADLANLANLRLVSVSVDPDRDTPQVLSSYAARYKADPNRWLFLTGTRKAIYDLVIDGFKLAVEEARINQQIIHDTRFVLVDAQGRIRGYYDSNSAEDLQQLRQDARQLAEPGGRRQEAGGS